MRARFLGAWAVVLAAALFFAPVSGALGQEKHAIDKWVDEQLDKEPSTAEMRAIFSKSYDMWDGELNRVYGELMKRLGQADREVLRAAQRSWLQYRDSEVKLIQTLVASRIGTMWSVHAAESIASLVRTRVMDLQGYLDVVKEAD